MPNAKYQTPIHVPSPRLGEGQGEVGVGSPGSRIRLLIAAFTGMTVLCSASVAKADDMTSASYRLWFGTMNITGGTKTSASYNLTDSVGQTAPGQYGQANNVVKSGFQYIYPLNTFTFKIAPLTIAFGSLPIGSFVTAQETIEVTSIGAGGYSVKVSEDHPMYRSNLILQDGAMEQSGTSAWTSLNGATLTKQTTSPHGGAQVLRVARNAANVFYAYQTVLTVGKTYRVTGFTRSDGTTTPNVSKGSGLIFTGTTSTSWQPFDVTFVATGTQLYFGDQSDSSGYVEFDDILLTDGSIPDTACDSGCTETTAKPWTSATNTGFGYNMSGDDASTDFVNSTYYKQFANLSVGKTPQTIMTSTHVGTKRHGVLTYKIAIGATQPTGDYQTQITYTVIPGY